MCCPPGRLRGQHGGGGRVLTLTCPLPGGSCAAVFLVFTGKQCIPGTEATALCFIPFVVNNSSPLMSPHDVHLQLVRV